MSETNGTENYDGVVPLIQAEFPGTQVAVEITARTSTIAATKVDQVKAAVTLRNCRVCDDAGVLGERVKKVEDPYYPGLEASWVVVLPPNADEQTWRLLKAVGLVGPDVAVVPRLGCMTKGRARANAGEVRNCYGNVADAIWAAGTDYVVLVGRDACEMWRSDLTVEQMDGTIGVLWDRYVVMGLRDPAWIAKTPNKVESKKLAAGLRANAERWQRAVQEGEGRIVQTFAAPTLPVTVHMATCCVACGKQTRWIDRDAIGWCDGCRNNGWMKARGLPANHHIAPELPL